MGDHHGERGQRLLSPQPKIGNTCKGSSLIRATTGLQADDQHAHDRDLGHIPDIQDKKPDSDPETKELLQMLAQSVITLKEEVQDFKMERPGKEAKAKSQAAPSEASSFELLPQ